MSTGTLRDESFEARVGRGCAIGAAVGFCLVTVAITIAGTLGGIEPGAALALGVFVGFWGGGGFGFMMGAMVTLLFIPTHNEMSDTR